MANTPEFRKGQLVNVFHGDSGTAAVKWAAYAVASCGLRQMHLIRADGSNAETRKHAPFRGDNRFHDVQDAGVDPVAHAAALRAQFAGWIRVHYDRRTQEAERGLAEGRIGAAGYAKAISEGRAKFEAATADLTPQ